jgi:hypothetical protein
MKDSPCCCKLMFVSRLQILLVVALVLLLSTTFASAQQQYPNSPRFEVPRVTLSASPATVVAGRQVRLVAQLSSGYPNIRFRFDFGDGMQSAWQTSTVVTHTYQKPGSYLPFVDIGVATDGGVTRLGGSPRRPIQVTNAPLGPLELHISPVTPEIGRPVTFRVWTASNDPNIRYRFGFGDSSPVGVWQSSPQAMHVYTTGGTYSPYVEVGRLDNRGLRQQWSAGRAIVVTAPAVKNRKPDSGPIRGGKETTVASQSSTPPPGPEAPEPLESSVSTPSPIISVPATSPRDSSSSLEASDTSVALTDGGSDWWRYLLLGLPLALLVFLVGKRFFVPRPAIRTFADPGTGSVTDSTGLVIDSQVVARPNVLQGEHLVSSDEDRLVKNVRREDV